MYYRIKLTKTFHVRHDTCDVRTTGVGHA